LIGAISHRVGGNNTDKFFCMRRKPPDRWGRHNSGKSANDVDETIVGFEGDAESDRGGVDGCGCEVTQHRVDRLRVQCVDCRRLTFTVFSPCLLQRNECVFVSPHRLETSSIRRCGLRKHNKRTTRRLHARHARGRISLARAEVGRAVCRCRRTRR
jgi:hypothetical protein